MMLEIEWADDFLPFVSENCQKVLTSWQRGVKNILLYGNRSCGKSYIVWFYILTLCCAIPKFRVYIAMEDWSRIPGGPIETLGKMLKHGADSEHNPFKLHGGIRRSFEMEFDNKARITFVGLNDPGKVKSKEFSLLWVDEISEVRDDEGWRNAGGSMLPGRRKEWKTACGNFYFSQRIASTNPAQKTHWHHKEFFADEYDEGPSEVELFNIEGLETKTEAINFTLKDNPFYSPDGIDLNTEGQVSWNDLIEVYGSSGPMFERYVLGKYLDLQGQVYEINDKNIVHENEKGQMCQKLNGELVPVWDDPLDRILGHKDWEIRRIIDWGTRSPTVCLWIAKNLIIKDVLVYQEYRKVRARGDELATAIREYSKERVKLTLTDHDIEKQGYLQDCGIHSNSAIKGKDSVAVGICLVNGALHRAQYGKQGGLYFLTDKPEAGRRGLVINQDPHPEARNYCGSTIQEMIRVQFDEEMDRLVKSDDHGPDCIRYNFQWDNKKRERVSYSATVEHTKSAGLWN